MSTLTPMSNWEERDLLEEIESRAWQYVLETKATPDVALLSSDLFVDLIKQMCEMDRAGPTVYVSKERGRWTEVATSSGAMSVEECDKFGSDFLFVGKKTDIFPKDGDCGLAEKLLLEDVQK
jgi:hypothetical protein